MKDLGLKHVLVETSHLVLPLLSNADINYILYLGLHFYLSSQMGSEYFHQNQRATNG